MMFVRGGRWRFRSPTLSMRGRAPVVLVTAGKGVEVRRVSNWALQLANLHLFGQSEPYNDGSAAL